jgi:FkbM family methyltransferase
MLPHDADFYGLRKLANARDLFLDVGANDGLSARSMRHLCPQKPILSIEPNPAHEKSLATLKAVLTGFDYRIVGAGSRAATFTLYTPTYKGHALTNYASMSPEAVRTNLATHMNIKGLSRDVELVRHLVKVVPLDDLNLMVDLVKIDVEGLEDAVVQGLAGTIDRCRPVLMIEHNPLSFSGLVAFLSSRRYRVCRYLKRSDTFVSYDNGPILNVFFIPAERDV